MKISIIGMGRVGTAIAFALTLHGLPQTLVLVGRDDALTQGEAFDLQHASVFSRPIEILAGKVCDTSNSDLVIICAAAPPSPFKTRLDFAIDNAKVYRELIPQIAKASPDAILVIVSNPVDVMTYLALKLSGFAPEKVFGTGTLVDTVRFRARLCELWQINAHDVRAYIIGEHGDSQFPALSVASFGGVKIHEQDSIVQAAAEEARLAGYRIVEQKGYSNYAIAAATLIIVDAIASNACSVFPVSTLVRDFHEVNDVCLSLPAVLGRQGIARVLPIDLDEREVEQFRTSAKLLKEVIDRLGGC